ncbi:hypothetical protein PVMG_02275 [Plasmodium vivax Mauritania I]|uniref:Uncharacterized protein n=1 Tax=Plasmodium vivax Mauritania I TaxID=1035515 RepID=A0A0J9TFS2_PLAVI|nr:hypothetical protein PVMG_02275 [Plasmodium vivax Mauritania I]
MSQNKMEDNEVDKMAITYDQYIYLKKKFDPNKPFSSEVVKLEDILRDAEITEDTKNTYLKAFKLLLKHIHHDGLFIHGNNQDACKYINYMLYKEVQHEIKRSYDKDLISIFHKFLLAYGKKHGMQNRCISNIYSIEDQTYNNINALYEVYDKYKECYLFNKNTIHLGCKKFEDFFVSYDNYMRDTQSNSLEFNKILEDIEKHAKNAVSLYRLGCYNYRRVPRSPQLFKPDPVQIPETHRQEQMLQTGLHSADNRSQYETQGRTHTQETQLPKVISISQPEHENKLTNEENSANDSHHSSSHQETIDSSIGSYEEQSQSYSRIQTPITPSYFSETSLYPRQHGHAEEKVLPNEVEMSPTSVMDTITSALKDVNPVPVVGVSGGMGALFLLFRVLEILNLHTYIYNIYK